MNVINLSPDKPAVFREAFRVLVPGGRLAISDIVAIAPLPPALAQDVVEYTGCVAGAALISDLEQMLTEAGFSRARIYSVFVIDLASRRVQIVSVVGLAFVSSPVTSARSVGPAASTF